MKVVFWSILAAFLATAEPVARPTIKGLAHVAFFSSDIERSRFFYHALLGYEEPFSLHQPDGKLAMTFFKINERQYVELFPERAAGTDRLHHIALETGDAEQMRLYLASRGVKVPDKVGKGRIGNANFMITDPDGHDVEIVQYLPDGWSRRDRGKALPPQRVSAEMRHAGVIVNQLEPAMKFYRDILGFREIWRGSRDSQVLDWVNMQVPDGTDYVEFMLHHPVPAEDKRGTAHHICLIVDNIEKAAEPLRARVAAVTYQRPLEIRTGINRKRQLNLYDVDGTRVELMEPDTVDGKPTPSSTALPPR